jgi:hypothetical protein
MCWSKYQNSLAGGKLYKLPSVLESTDGCTKVQIQNVCDVTCQHFDYLNTHNSIEIFSRCVW